MSHTKKIIYILLGFLTLQTGVLTVLFYVGLFFINSYISHLLELLAIVLSICIVILALRKITEIKDYKVYYWVKLFMGFGLFFIPILLCANILTWLVPTLVVSSSTQAALFTVAAVCFVLSCITAELSNRYHIQKTPKNDNLLDNDQD